MRAPLQFAQVREDPLLDLKVAGMAAGPERRALVVASAGDTALSLLTDPGIAAIDAVDINPTQLALCRLKAAAVAGLPLAGSRALLGVDAHDDRIGLFEAIAPALDGEDQAFWREHEDWLTRGVLHAGNFEKLFAVWREVIHQFVAGPTQWEHLTALADPEAQSRLFSRWENRYWPVAFRLAFHADLLEVMFGPAATQHAERPYPTYFEAVFRRAIATLPAADNYFLHQLVLGRYAPSEQGVPPYLQPRHYAGVQARLGRLRWHLGTLPEMLSERPGERYDFLQVSNVFDWLDAESRQAVAAAVIGHAAPSSRILVRQLNNRAALPPAWQGRTRSDPAGDEALWAADRSVFYSRVQALEVLA